MAPVLAAQKMCHCWEMILITRAVKQARRRTMTREMKVDEQNCVSLEKTQLPSCVVENDTVIALFLHPEH